MPQLPTPRTLRLAVEEVIRQNRDIGYPPTRFIGAVDAFDGDELRRICANLILNPRTLEDLERALAGYPKLLTIEDLVVRSRYSKDWGFGEHVITEAQARIQWLDSRVGYQRWFA